MAGLPAPFGRECAVERDLLKVLSKAKAEASVRFEPGKSGKATATAAQSVTLGAEAPLLLMSGTRDLCTAQPN
jgi:hypothetical protein